MDAKNTMVMVSVENLMDLFRNLIREEIVSKNEKELREKFFKSRRKRAIYFSRQLANLL